MTPAAGPGIAQGQEFQNVLRAAQEIPAPHRRYNPLTDEWVLVSAGRTRRPWQGQEDAPVDASRPTYDPDCYLCPGNVRASGSRNPDYTETFVFTNDYPSLTPDVDLVEHAPHPLLRAHTQAGTCRVICFSPRHDLTLAEMEPAGVRAVVDMWADQVTDLAGYAWVQVFENRGEAMGASNPHPHGQIWASAVLPSEPAKEDAAQRRYLAEHGSNLLEDYAALESELASRVIVHATHWLAVVPYWALWPFEVLLVPRRRVSRLPALTSAERDELAVVLGRMLARYDNLFEYPFPYSMGWHGAPGHTDDAPHWQLHAHFYPPLLRSASVRKFMVGYEMLANPQRDLTPEAAAARLRSVSDVHYRIAKTG